MSHPITPPPELVEQWADMLATHTDTEVFFAAAQWGADQELEACCEWLFKDPATHDLVGRKARYLDFELRAARRPKPPSLKEQALVALHAIATGANDMREQRQDFETIRHALEQLDD